MSALRRRLSRRCALATAVLGVALAAAAPSRADRVVLLNGQVFEDVSTSSDDEVVRIHLGGGALVLPKSQVASVEPGSSTVEDYRVRAEELRRDPDASAARWLELARWSRSRGFLFGAREAGLAAAELDPKLAGLEPILRPLGYEIDPESGRWYPYEEAMRRRGWVLDGDDWVPPSVAAARAEERLAAREERRRASEAARLDRLATLTELRLVTDLAEPEPQPQPVFPWWWTWGAWGAPIVVAPWPPAGEPEPPKPGPSPDPGASPSPSRSHHGEREMIRRQPGSVLPVGSGG
jgi:hypothetical protein